jgi:hypothetical protein
MYPLHGLLEPETGALLKAALEPLAAPRHTPQLRDPERWRSGITTRSATPPRSCQHRLPQPRHIHPTGLNSG